MRSKRKPFFETDWTYNCVIWDSTTSTWQVDRSIVYPEYIDGYQVGCTIASYAEETSIVAVIARMTTFTPTFTPTLIPTIDPTGMIIQCFLCLFPPKHSISLKGVSK